MTDNGLPLVDGKWEPKRSGDYAKDNRRGNRMAEQLHEHMLMTENPAFFGTVMRAITAAGRYEGVEIGFCSRFGIMLLGV